MSDKRPVSIRLTDDEIELLAEIGSVLGRRSGQSWLSRAATVRALMQRAKPGEGPDNAPHRAAYRKVFGE